MSFYFYRESKKSKIQAKEFKSRKENPFLTGITLSVLNMFAIPFFSGTAIFLDTFNLLYFDVFSIVFFIIGSVMGTFFILFFCGRHAKFIQQKTGKLTKDINLILAFLTGFIAVFTILKLIFTHIP